MDINSENLKLIFGLKLRQWRDQRNFSLKTLSEKAGLSVSYLSEIESGKKYPKPEKIIQLAKAMGVSFDELVSANVDEEKNSVSSFMRSPIFQEFPFQLFGISLGDVVGLVKDSPIKAAALVRTLSEIGEMYDLRVEQFFFAALRSYQKMHGNYFEEIERAAESFLKQNPVHGKSSPYPSLCTILKEKYEYIIDEETISRYPDLKGFRSVWINGHPARLLINGLLLPSQKAFIAGHALAYEFLKLSERPVTSSWLKVESFEQVLNNFKASYFAGALLIQKESLIHDLKNFFKNKKWDGEKLLSIMRKYDATPEMFLYRLTQLIPHFFGLEEIYFLRFNHAVGSGHYQLTKELNMSRFFVPHGIGLNEHYCRRWLSIKLLQAMPKKNKKNPEVKIAAQRSAFIDSGAEFFTISLTRPLVLSEGTHSCVTIGLLMNDEFKKVVSFWEDTAVPQADVNETCERCHLTKSQCKERVAPSLLYHKEQTQEKRERALDRLMEEMKQK